MKITFRDYEDDRNPSNGSEIHDDRAMRALIDSFQNREPFICEFAGENGYHLEVGLGGTIGCAQFSSSDGEPPYLVATSGTQDDGKVFGFFCGGTLTEILSRHCLPIEVITDILCCFQRTGEKSPNVEWSEV